MSHSEASSFKAPYMMWKAVKEGHGTMTFFGALHFGTTDMYPLPQPLVDAIEQAHTAAFETNLQELSSPSFSTRLQEMGKQPEEIHLHDNLSAETWNQLTLIATNLGYTAEFIDSLKPWYCASLLTSSALRISGLDNYTGVDSYIYNWASGLNKNILPLETTERQLELLSSISNKTDEEFIRQTIDEINDMKNFSSRMLKLWLNSNPDGLAELITEGFADNDDLQKQMLDQRNYYWFSCLDQASQNNTSVLTVVGAGHLVGAHSLLTIFRHNGYSITP